MILNKTKAGLFIIFALLIVQCSGNPEKFKISGTVPSSLKSDSLFVYDMDLSVIAKTKVENNKFVIQGNVKHPTRAILGNINQNVYLANLALENDNFTYEKNGETYEIMGGKINTELTAFYKDSEYRKIEKEYNVLLEKMSSITNEKQLAELENKIEAKSEDMVRLETRNTQRIMEGNFSDFTKLMALVFTENLELYDAEKKLKMLDDFEKRVGKNKVIDEQRKYLSSYENTQKKLDPQNDKSLKKNDGYVDFEVAGLDGKMHKLSTTLAKNKLTMVDFWASWCKPCRGEFPGLIQNYENFHAKGFEVFAISIDQRDEDWKQAMKEEQITDRWENYNEPNEKSDIIKTYGVYAVPTTYLLNNEGKIIAKNDELRGENLKKTIEKFLK